MAIMESMNAHIYRNNFERVKYGIRLSVGASNNFVEDNTFSECDQCELVLCGLLVPLHENKETKGNL